MSTMAVKNPSVKRIVLKIVKNMAKSVSSTIRRAPFVIMNKDV